MPNPKDLSPFRIHSSQTALCIVDFQERLATAMPEAERIACERNIILLLELAQRQGWPVLVSEQYPKGLGPTVSSLLQALGARPHGVLRMEKLHFSLTDELGFDQAFAEIARTHWVVTGMETHVCVFQTVRGLLERGASVHVPMDASVSRSPDNRARGLALIEQMGGVITCTETVVFDALNVAGSDDFKTLSRRLR